MKPSAGRALRRISFLLALFTAANVHSQTRTLRIAAYNIEADIGVTNKQSTFTNIVTSSGTGPVLPGLIAPATNGSLILQGGVLEGIGEEVLKGNAQPVDVLALEETTSNPGTVTAIVNGLNTFYGIPGMYADSPYQATEEGGDTGDGNGPNAVVYNTHTVQLLASSPVDPAGGTSQLGGYTSGLSGEYREVMRYQFAPADVVANTGNTFYLYVSHYKSGSNTTSNNWESRVGEAQIVRSNMIYTLPAGSRILHVGDFNTGETSEPMYGVLIVAGVNQLIDPLNTGYSLTTNFDSGSVVSNLTDSDTFVQYRDDYQIMTTNVYYGPATGLKLVPGTYHTFGNNGSIGYKGTASSGNTVLNNNLVTNGPVFVPAAQLYVDLTGASDHFPVVADYIVPMPQPMLRTAKAAGANLVLTGTNAITNAVYVVLTSPNITAPLASWQPVATNAPSFGPFTFTVTNVVSATTPAQFFILETQ